MRPGGYLFVLAAALGLLGLALGLVPREDVVKPAHAQSTIPGPNFYFYAAVTTAQQLIPQNFTRHALQICNSGATNALWIMPQGTAINSGGTVTPAANVGIVVPVVTTGFVNCFAPPVNAPAIGQGWNGFSIGTPTTVLEWP